MLAPSVLGITGGAAHSNHLVGALILTVAIIALAEVGRAVRFVNVILGAWVIASPWLLGGTTTAATWNDMTVGTLVILLSFPRGPVFEQYGSFQRYIR
jgi:SPW repeat